MRIFRLFAAVGAFLALLNTEASASGAFGNAPSDDVTSSMGVFRIVVSSQYADVFTNLFGNGTPFWDPTTRRLTSPVLYDNFTTIGRSAGLQELDPADVLGVAVGSAGTMIKDGDMVAPPGFETGSPTDYEVHTEVRSMNLQSGQGCSAAMVCNGGTFTMSVVGGRGMGAGFPICPGEIESNVGDGFPARSFFNVFVQATLGTLGSVENHLSDPLIVAKDPISSFPPKVVYIHENSSAVKVYWRNAGSASTGNGTVSWSAGDFFGFLVLAGHGEDMCCPSPANPDTCAQDCEQFWNTVTAMPEMNVGVDEAELSGLWLAPIVPDPARNEILVRFSLPKQSSVSLTAFDLAGRKLGDLAHGTLGAGEHRVKWDFSGAGKHYVGFYVIRLRVGDRVLARRGFRLR